MINGTLPGFPKQGPGTRDSDQWFTPTAVVEAARAAMGGIDLDPASCAEAQARVRAARWIGAPDDGLAAAWSGRIWLNPPYSDPRPWAEKLAAGWRSGRVAAGIILIHATAALGSAYGLRLMDEASLAVFPGRIRFVRPGGSPRRRAPGRFRVDRRGTGDRCRARWGRAVGRRSRLRARRHPAAARRGGLNGGRHATATTGGSAGAPPRSRGPPRPGGAQARIPQQPSWSKEKRTAHRYNTGVKAIVGSLDEEERWSGCSWERSPPRWSGTSAGLGGSSA